MKKELRWPNVDCDASISISTSPEPAPGKTVIEVWATIDFPGDNVELHLNEPRREKFFQDDEDSYWISRGNTYEFSDKFFPTLTPEKPQRVRIEITLIDEKGE